MWRRVSCEQPLDTSQSILSLSGNIIKCWRRIWFSSTYERSTRTKGNQVLIPELGSVTVFEAPRFKTW